MQSLDQIAEELYSKFTQQTKAKTELSIKPRVRAASAIKRTPLNPHLILKNATMILNRKIQTKTHYNLHMPNDRYKEIESIASGAYATVYKAKDTFTNQMVFGVSKQVAIKKFQKSLPLLEKKALILRENEILQKLEHRRIVKHLGCVEYSIILEYVDGITLTELIQNQPYKRLLEKDAIGILEQLREVVLYMHKNNICHRDLKTDNVMIIGNEIKIIDFGLATDRLILNDYSGTPAYMAPEIFSQKPYDGRKADIWSVGIIFYYLIIGRVPFNGKNDQQIQQQQQKLIIPNYVTQKCTKILQNLLNLDFIKRVL